MVKRVAKTLARFVREEHGAEGLEKLLIIAVIVLPLLAVLIWYRDDIREWIKERWEELRQEKKYQ